MLDEAGVTAAALNTAALGEAASAAVLNDAAVPSAVRSAGASSVVKAHLSLGADAAVA